MWMQRILLLLLLQRVLGHTLSRYEPQESEVYELKQDKDTNTVQFVYPKSSVPKLREIVYYHIIERPYESPSEEATVDVTTESETERSPTNTHGYQFLDNLLVDYDSAAESSTNPPEEQEYYYDENGYLYQVPAADQNEENPAKDADTYEPVEEPAETEEEETVESAETSDPQKTAVEETIDVQETSNDNINYNGEDDSVTEKAETDLYATEDNTDLTESESNFSKTNKVLTETESDLAETGDIMDETHTDNTADVAVETTEPMTVEATDISQNEELAVDEIVKKLEARNQLYESPDVMKERLLKIRSYLPHLHPMNSQFGRRRRRRSVQVKRNSRRRREILYIYPQGRSLIEPYDESEIPAAPTLSPMDTAGLPDYIKSELNPEHNVNAESDAEAAETVSEDSGFVPPSNTYGVKLDNGNGYVWNTLYGSANSEPDVTGEEEYTTSYPAPIEELPKEEPAYGEILEENLDEEEPGVAEETPSDIPEETFVDESEESAVEPVETEEIPADVVTDELTRDYENVEQSLPEAIEEVTIMEVSPDNVVSEEGTTENPEDALERKLLEIFDSLRELEKKRESSEIHQSIERRIHEYLEAEKSLLLEPLVDETVEPEGVDVVKQEQPTITDDLVDQEKELFGNDDGDIALETDSEGNHILPEEHGTYGFRLIGGQGEVWNDFTGVRYHVGNDKLSSDNFENIEHGFIDLNKPDDNSESILEPFESESEITSEDRLKATTDDSGLKEVSPKNDITDVIGNIFKDLKNLTLHSRDKQVSTALPDSLDQSSPFLALLEDDMYRDWVREWTIEYTRFLSEYINDTVQAAIAKKELELLNDEAPLEEDAGTSRLYINDQELTKSPAVDTIIDTISDKYLRRRRKHCKVTESNAGVTAETGGPLESGKIVNVFVFFTEEQGKKILDIIKPETNDEDIETEYVDASDGEYKPDESELDEAEEDESIADNETPIEVIVEQVDETTEASIDDSEVDMFPEAHPELVEEPEITEENAESIPEESEAEEVIDVAEEPVVEQEIIETEPAQEVTDSEIDNVASADMDEVTAEPVEIFTNPKDEEQVVISELPEEPVLEEEESGDALYEPIENTEFIKEEAVGDAEPIEKGAVAEIETIEEEEEIEEAEPAEQEAAVEVIEPVEEEEEVEYAKPVEEEINDDEPVLDEGKVENAEPVEEEMNEAEPELDVRIEDIEPIEEAIDVEPKFVKEVEVAEPVEYEEVNDAEPVLNEAVVENFKPIEEEAKIEDVEPVEEGAEVENAEPVEEEMNEAKPELDERIEDIEPIEEAIDVEPIVKEVEVAEPVEFEEVNNAEPVVNEAVVENTKPIEEEAKIEDIEPVEEREVEESAVEVAEPVEQEEVNDSKPVEEEAVVNSEPIEEEAKIEDVEPVEEGEEVEESAVEAAEPVEQEEVNYSKPVEEQAVVNSEPIEEEAVDDSEPIVEEVVVNDDEEAAAEQGKLLVEENVEIV